MDGLYAIEISSSNTAGFVGTGRKVSSLLEITGITRSTASRPVLSQHAVPATSM